MKAILSAILLSFLTVACYNNYHEPTIEGSSNSTTATLAELYRMCNSDILAPKSDIIVSGTVISCDKHSFLSKVLYIDDGTATAQIAIGMYNINSLYPEGCKISINLNGLGATIREYQLQIGMVDKSDPTLLKQIESEVLLDKFISRDSSLEPIEPLKIVVSDLSTKLCGKLVTLERMSHISTHPDDTNIACGYHRFSDIYGNHTYIYIDQYSSAYNRYLPTDEVTIPGIVVYRQAIYNELNCVAITPRRDSDIGM